MIVEHNEDGDGVVVELAPGEAFDLVQELDSETEYCFAEHKPSIDQSPRKFDRHSPLLNLHEKLTNKVRDYVLGDKELRERQRESGVIDYGEEG